MTNRYNLLTQDYIMKRRAFLKNTLLASAATATALVAPSALAKWTKETFEAEGFDAVMAAIGADKAETSDKITIKAPEIAENGMVVPITISTDIAGVTAIHLLIKENPSPLTASFTLSEKAIPSVKSRIKMGKSSDVIAVVKAGDKTYMNTVAVKVTKGGCGG